MGDSGKQPTAGAAAEAPQQQQQQQQKMMLLQVNETDWAVVMLDEVSGDVRELQIDAGTAQKVQAGELSPDQLAAMLAQQQAAAEGSSSEGQGQAS